jgi:hypothetical protein
MFRGFSSHSSLRFRYLAAEQLTRKLADERVDIFRSSAILVIKQNYVDISETRRFTETFLENEC